RPAATWRRSLRACIASLPLHFSLMSKTYLKSDHFSGGGSGAVARHVTLQIESRSDAGAQAPSPVCVRAARRGRALGASSDVVLCPDGIPFVGHRLDCCDLLRRGVIYHGTTSHPADP